MKHTEKYQLTQWERQDRIQMEAFNSDNAKIEAALAAETAARTAADTAEAEARAAAVAAEAETRAAAVAAEASARTSAVSEETSARTAAVAAEAAARTAALALKGNCQIYSINYQGTGRFGDGSQTSFTFPAPPDLVVVFGTRTSPFTIFQRDQTHAVVYVYNQNQYISLSWTGNTVSWYSNYSAEVQLNDSGQKYALVAFYAMDN